MNNFFFHGAQFALVTALVATPAPWANAAGTSIRSICADAAPKPEPAKPDMTFSEANNGQTVAVRVGAIFEVRFESNASTGYEWSVTKQDKEALEGNGKSQFVAPAELVPGAPGQQVFRFKVKRAGNTKLELQLARPWEKDKAARKFALIVSAKKKKD